MPHKDPEKRRAYNKDYYKAYREANREEMLAYQKAYREANRETLLAKQKAYREANREKKMLAAAKERARRDNLPFNIDVSDIVIPEFCPVFPAIRLTRAIGKPQDSSPSLDKIIPARGYVKGNVRVISYRANTLLSNMTLEEAELVLKDKRRIYLVPSPRVSLLQKTKLRGVG